MMNDQDEKLSALLDDYRHTDEDQSTLRDLQNDVNQQYTLQRYQMIGDVMRNELPDQVQLDFAASVRAKIADEAPLQAAPVAQPQQQSAASKLWSRLFKPAAGLAVAASVALVTISSLQVNNETSAPDQSVAVVDPASQAKVEQFAQIPVINSPLRVSANPLHSPVAPGMKWKIKRSKPNAQDKLNTYLINHNEYSSSMHGIIPQARVVGFDDNR